MRDYRITLSDEEEVKMDLLYSNPTKVQAGEIELIDVMPHPLSQISMDTRICEAARISRRGGGTKGTELDTKLITTMMRGGHSTPFEHIVMTMKIKCPIFVARQWMRHRTWSYNEVSRRYTAEAIEFWRPEVFPLQSDINKQGRREGNWPDDGNIDFSTRWSTSEKEAYELYLSMVHGGVAREIARGILPVTLYTEFYGTVNIGNLIKFLTLRCDSHAQKEIRDFAMVIRDIFFAIMAPITYNVYMEWIEKKAEPSGQ